MKEDTGDLFEYPADLRVITTNGSLNSKGAAVMGRGCAREVRDRLPGADRRLGELLKQYGNRPFKLGREYRINDADIGTLPVKSRYNDMADIALIDFSCRLLVRLVDRLGYERIVLVRPGCGNGSLKWSEVHPVVSPLLDKRFTVIERPS